MSRDEFCGFRLDPAGVGTGPQLVPVSARELDDPAVDRAESLGIAEILQHRGVERTIGVEAEIVWQLHAAQRLEEVISAVRPKFRGARLTSAAITAGRCNICSTALIVFLLLFCPAGPPLVHTTDECRDRGRTCRADLGCELSD